MPEAKCLVCEKRTLLKSQSSRQTPLKPGECPMHGFRRTAPFLAAIALALAGVLSCTSSAVADDPVPIDPTLSATGGFGGAGTPVVATPEVWDLIVMLVVSIEPDVDYGTVCNVALSWFN